MSNFESDTKPTTEERHHPLLKMALEIGPLMVFFFGNLRGEWLAKTFPALTAVGGPLLIATALFMVATVISLIVSKIVFKHLPIMPFVSGIVVLVFGGLSIWLQDETFIKMKPTIINTLFGVVLLGGLALRKNPLKLLLGDAVKMPEEGWRKLTLNYGLFFLTLAAINEVVWRTQPDDIWVVFRFPGLLILSVLFSFAQVPLMMKYAKTDEPPPPHVE